MKDIKDFSHHINMVYGKLKARRQNSAVCKRHLKYRYVHEYSAWNVQNKISQMGCKNLHMYVIMLGSVQ